MRAQGLDAPSCGEDESAAWREEEGWEAEMRALSREVRSAYLATSSAGCQHRDEERKTGEDQTFRRLIQERRHFSDLRQLS